MISILFVCTGNRCRSPLAEVLARREWGAFAGAIELSSAGLHASPGGEASPHARQVALENDLELESHRAHSLDATELEGAELVLTMGAAHKAEILRR